MTWALLALLVVSNAFWLAVVWASGKRITQLERLLGQAAMKLDEQAGLMAAIMGQWPKGRGN